MRHHGHWNHTSPTEMPDSPVAERWRVLLPAVSLTFGILASAIFALRIYASKSPACKIRAEDVLMGISVVLMWGTVASVLLSECTKTLPDMESRFTNIPLQKHITVSDCLDGKYQKSASTFSTLYVWSCLAYRLVIANIAAGLFSDTQVLGQLDGLLQGSHHSLSATRRRLQALHQRYPHYCRCGDRAVGTGRHLLLNFYVQACLLLLGQVKPRRPLPRPPPQQDGQHCHCCDWHGGGYYHPRHSHADTVEVTDAQEAKDCHDGRFGYWSIVSLFHLRSKNTANRISVCIFSLLRVVQFFYFDLEHISSEYTWLLIYDISVTNNAQQLRLDWRVFGQSSRTNSPSSAAALHNSHRCSAACGLPRPRAPATLACTIRRCLASTPR